MLCHLLWPSSDQFPALRQRKRLHRLVAAARAVSLYSPSLLVLDCTETSGNDSSAARDVLGIDALEGLAATRVYRPQLLDAEASFAENVEALLGAVRVLRGRILIPVRGEPSRFRSDQNLTTADTTSSQIPSACSLQLGAQL